MNEQLFIGEIIKFVEQVLEMPETKTSPEMVAAISKLVALIKS